MNNYIFAAAFDASLLEMALSTTAMRESFNIHHSFGEDEHLAGVLRRAAHSALEKPVRPLDSDTSGGLVRHACAGGIVLLKNKENVLPFSDPSIRTVAVIGPCAEDGIYRDVMKIAPPYVQVINAAGCPPGDEFSDELLAAALYAAVRADAVILCLGAANDDGTRLPAPQLALLEAVTMLGKPVAAAVFGTFPHALESIHDKADAVVMAWEYTRCHGAALVHILFGQVNPSGRLPITIPRSGEEISPYQFAGAEPLYPFGYGLSYSRFAYSRIRALRPKFAVGEHASVECSIENTGILPGHETAQIYLRQEGNAAGRWQLCGFKRVFLHNGESKTASFDLPTLEIPSRYTVFIGGHQPDARSVWLTETPVLSTFIEVVGTNES
ncbi:MAG: glycoside hydrolase family 3 C-terminal domain-containing protein [Oscillospiraceae bacterium]|nr:glycoside hydrolase family 3 C-terminal domain-containing protein [Oscillospiraceae bacterium]